MTIFEIGGLGGRFDVGDGGGLCAFGSVGRRWDDERRYGRLGLGGVEVIFPLGESGLALVDGAFSPLKQAYAVAFGGWRSFGFRGQGAEFGVVDDFLDRGQDDVVFVLVGALFGEVEGGDLEGVEEESGAAGIEIVGGDALHDFAEGGLDGGAVLK